MTTADNHVFIEFEPHEKALILHYAGFVCSPSVTKQLRDGRYRHIEFTAGDLNQISGELSRVVNHANLPYEEADLLDFICSELERHL